MQLLRDSAAAAVAINLPIDLVDSAVAHYLDKPKEVDAWIECNRSQAAEAEAVWRRRRTSTQT